MADAPVPGWNAHRFPQDPLRQPKYHFDDIPKCAKDLSGSMLQKVTDRDQLKECMAEMVLLCNEALRRSKRAKDESKPLSLEYIADRLDVDDPLFGYLVRTSSGMMQGFVTITTFTNWQKTFRWDSRHDLAFYFDNNTTVDSGSKNTNENRNANKRNSKSHRNSDDDESDGAQKDRHAGTKQQEHSFHDSSATGAQDLQGSLPKQSNDLPGLHHCGRTRTVVSTDEQDENNPPGQIPREPALATKATQAIDVDGSLSCDMQNTVHLGDPYNEGIVWPRIAELSLLGAIGCGRVLVSLIIDHLETQKPSLEANYDFIVLQATKNSIPFYESIGFVRVGAITEARSVSDDDKPQSVDDSSHQAQGTSTPNPSPAEHQGSDGNSTSTDGSGAQVAVTVDDATTSAAPDAVARTSPNLVSSPVVVYEVKSAGKTLSAIAKTLKVDVWDILFLNKDVYQDIQPRSRLMKGTLLYVPDLSKRLIAPKERKEPPQWFVAKENDTPRKISQKFRVSCNALVMANQSRLPGLHASARLKGGTRVKVSNLDGKVDNCVPYCHWSFPDDTADNGEPSYMMAYRLNRKGGAHKQNPILASLSVPIKPFADPPLLLPRPSKQLTGPPSKKGAAQAPTPPDRPATSFDLFKEHQLALDPTMQGKPPGRLEKIMIQKWRMLPDKKQQRYDGIAKEGMRHYERAVKEHEEEYAAWAQRLRTTAQVAKATVTSAAATAAAAAAATETTNVATTSMTATTTATTATMMKSSERNTDESQSPPPATSPIRAPTASSISLLPLNRTRPRISHTLFNKVIKLEAGAVTKMKAKYTYWFVLTYIPDLQWCRLAPMYRDGYHGEERKKSAGRPKWRLVDESLGHEIDISAQFCVMVKSKALRKTADADKEEWDIIDGNARTNVQNRRPGSCGRAVSSTKDSTSRKIAISSHDVDGISHSDTDSDGSDKTCENYESSSDEDDNNNNTSDEYDTDPEDDNYGDSDACDDESDREGSDTSTTLDTDFEGRPKKMGNTNEVKITRKRAVKQSKPSEARKRQRSPGDNSTQERGRQPPLVARAMNSGLSPSLGIRKQPKKAREAAANVIH